MHTSAAEYDEELIDEIYAQLGTARWQFKSHEVVIVIGDLNATVGKGRQKDVVGLLALGIEMIRGDRWVDWCIENQKVIANTWYRHHPSHLCRWKSPGDMQRDQTDCNHSTKKTCECSHTN